MKVKLRPEFWMIREIHGRVGNWIYRTRKGKNGKPEIYAHYSPKKGSDPDPEKGKMF